MRRTWPYKELAEEHSSKSRGFVVEMGVVSGSSIYEGSRMRAGGGEGGMETREGGSRHRSAGMSWGSARVCPVCKWKPTCTPASDGVGAPGGASLPPVGTHFPP